MKKKLLSLLVCTVMLLSVLNASAAYKDVPETVEYYKQVQMLDALKIIDGDENGNYNPSEPITRAEFAKLIIRLLGFENTAADNSTVKFDDCKNHWAAGYIELGTALGFIDGFDDKHFAPDNTVTYAQAVKMVVNALGYEVYAESKGGWPNGYMTYGSSLEILKKITGINNDTTINRAGAAVILANALDVPLCDTEYNGDMKIYDGTGGKEYKTILTENFDTYIVNGKITGTSLTSDIKKGEVQFQVEKSKNFNGKAYSAEPEVFTMKLNTSTSTASELLYLYCEAWVQKDSNDEWTIIMLTEK